MLLEKVRRLLLMPLFNYSENITMLRYKHGREIDIYKRATKYLKYFFAAAWNPLDYTKKDIVETWRSSDEAHFNREHYIPKQGNTDELSINYGKFNKAVVKVAEVQTQTVNDMATQTDISADKRDTQDQLSEVHEATYERSLSRENEVLQLSLDSAEQYEDLDQIEKMSLPSKIRTMSEISLHETTSSIKTETGTEISISTRDVTCSFNQYLDLEVTIFYYNTRVRL
jgi:hypothetical protein